MTVPELFQFARSHYNEKARWALDYKGVPHVRRTLLPGPHKLSITRLSGQPMVPVLRDGGEIVPGSTRIIEHLEARHPERPLYPAEDGARRRALEIQRWFDEEVGAEIRRAKFFDVLPDAGYVTRVFAEQAGPLARGAYRALFPMTRLLMVRQMKIDADTAARSRERTREALDFVVREAGPDGYLVGDSFTVADLTAAALLALVAWLPGTSMGLPEPRPPVEETWMARWADHPGTAWVTDMYRRHRGTSAEVRAA